MSVHREFAQRPSNYFRAAAYDANFAYSTYLYTDEELQESIAYAPSKRTVNGSMVTYSTAADLITGMGIIWNGLDVLHPHGIPSEPYELLLDMGKEYNFGFKGGDSKILTMRRVQRTNGTAASGGVGGTAPTYNCYWTPIINKLSASSELNPDPTNPILPVTVSRI